MNNNFIKALSANIALVKTRVFSVVLVLILAGCFIGVSSQKSSPTAHATTSSNINFQARLLTSSGNTVPDGYYNIRFKLYDGGTQGGPGGTGQANAGSQLWTESYYDSNGVTAGNDNRLRVVNGYVTVNLGSQSAFGAIDWDQELWLTMDIGGTTQTATPTYDGEMLGSVPAANSRLKLTAVPYAFKAGQLAKRTGANTSTLDFATQTGARSILLPDESGTLCIQTSTSCGFALTSGSGNYIQNGTGVQTANFYVQSGAAGSIGGIVQGHASQSADIFRAVTSSGTGLIVTSAGEVYETQRFSVASSNLANTVNSKLAIQPGVATTLGQVIRGFTAQTADLFQIQDSAGTILTSFDASGKLVFGPSGSQDTNLYRSAANSLKTDDDFLVGSNLTLSSGGNITQTGSATFSTGTGSISLNGATTLSSTFSQTGANTFSTGTGSISLNGATSVTGTNTLTVGTGLTSLGGQLDVTGSVAFKKGTDFSTTGTTNDASFGEVSLIRLSGASTQTITGIANGRDGEILTLVNSASQSATITNNDSGSTAANRIITGTGANITLTAGGSITLVYDSSASFWRVIGSVGFSTGSFIQNSTSLQTTANFNIQSAALGSVGGVIQGASGQTADLFQLKDGTGAILAAFDSAGRLLFGPSGSQDTNLYRSTANTLKTDDDLLVGNSLTFGASGGTITAGGTIAANGGSITTSAASFSIANTNATTVNAFGAATTVNLGAAGVVIQGAGAVTLQAGGTNTSLTLQGNGTGSVSLGTTASAHSTTVGSTTSTSTTTIQAGSGGLVLSPSGSSNTGVIVRPATSNSTAAFQIQNQAGTATLLNADTTNMRISIGSNGTATGQLYVAGSIPSSVSSLSTGGQNSGVYVQGRYAYVVNTTNDTLQIVDISVPTSPVSISTIATGTSPRRVYVQGRYAYVIDNADNTLMVFDVSNPASPTSVSTVSTATNAFDVFVQGRYVYVALFNGATSMQIFDVSNPASPTVVGSGGTTNVPYSVYVQGRYAYIANFGADTLQIFDVSNPASPTSVGSVALLGADPEYVYVQGRYAYVTIDGTTDYLQVIDVSNPASPTSVGSLVLSSAPNNLIVQGRYVYIAISSSAFQVVDVSNPASPTSVGTYSSGSLVWLNVQGRYAYGVDSTNLRVYDLGGAYVQQLEAGGIETGTLTANSNVSVGNNASIQGGLTVAGHSELSGNVTVAGLLDSVGSVAFKKGTDFSTTGTTNNANFGDVSLVRLTGASAQTITGMTGGRDGEMLTIVNAAGQSATLSNATGSSAGNQIITGTGANITLPAGGTITLVYDSVAGYWRVTGSVAFSTGNYIQNGTSLQSTANFNIQSAASGSIGGIIRGASGQTERLLLFRDGTSGADLSAITADGSFIANSYGTGTTATTSGTGSNTTTVTLTGSAFANNDVILIDNAGQDYYTRIVSGGGTSTLTVSPAVTFENARTVTKYNTQNIGSYTTDYSTQYRFFQGSFLGGVAVGSTAGTVLSDGALSTGLTTFNLLNTTATTVNAFGAASTINLGATGGATIQGGGALTLQSATGTAVSLDSGTTGAVNIGTGASAKTITMGSTSSTALNLRTGTSFSLDGVTGTTYDIGTSTTTGTIALGGTGQTGTMTLGRSTATNIINIGASAGGSNTQTINIGTSATASSTTNVTIGSTIAGTTAIQGTTTVTGRTSGSGTTLNVSNSTSTGSIFVAQDNSTAVMTIADGGATTFANQTNSTTAFRVQNASSGNLLQIDTTNNAITLAGNNSAEITSWSNSPNALPGSPLYTSSVVLNGYVYVMTGWSGSYLDTIYYAKLNADGSTGVWANTKSSPTALDSTSAVTANGYIYLIGGRDSGSVAQTSVYYAKPNADGTINSWNTTTSLPVASYGQGSVVVNGFLYVTGGSAGSGVYYSKINSDGTIGSWSKGPSLNSSRSYTTSTTANGYIYTIGGSFTDTTEYAQVRSDGSLSVWTTSGNVLPQTRSYSSTVTANGYMYSIAGFNGATQGEVYYTRLNSSNGSIGSWTQATNSLSPGRYGLNAVIANGYIYALSGGTATVAYTSVERIKIGGSLDLVGLNGGDLTSGDNGVGGSLTAGNTNVVGSLTVRGNTSLGNGLVVAGETTIMSKIGADKTFTVQNASGANIFDISTPLINVINNYGFEDATVTGWAAKGGTSVSNTNTAGEFYNGSRALKVTAAGSPAANDGVQYDLGLSANTTYTFSFFAKASAGATANLDFGYSTNGSTDTSCIATASTFTTSGFTQYTCNFTTPSSVSGTTQYLYIKQTDTTSRNIFIDDVRLTTQSGISLTVGGADTGHLQNWASTTALPGARDYNSTVTANGYVYIIGGSASSTVYYAKLNADGTIGSWVATTALPAARERHTSFVSNGYIYVVGGDNGGTAQSTVYYAKLNADGTIGSWATNTALPAARREHTSVVANGYVYVIAGSSGSVQSTVYYAKLNSDGIIGTWGTTTSLATANYLQMAVTSGGYIYVMGGASPITANAFSARINPDGTLGSWTSINSMPAARYRSVAVVSNGYIYQIAGANGSGFATTFFAKLNNNGTLGTWQSSAPVPDIIYDHSSVVSNGYIYTFGGTGGTSTYYTSTQRLKLGGALDLLALSGGNYADGSTGLGGELTAGNTNIVGSLSVRGPSSFGNGLSVSGEANFQSKIGADKSFTAQNASARSLFDISTPITNNIYNSTFETNNTIGWAVKGGTTISNSNTAGEFYNGARGFKITAAGSPAANDGAKYTTRLNPSTAYTLKFYAKASAGATANLDFGYSRDGSTDTSCLASSATFATSYTYYTCNFTTPTTVPSGSTYIYVKQTDTTSRDIFIDDIYLETQSTATLTLGEAGSAQLQTWGTTTAPTATLGAHTTVVYNGFIYAIGGYSGSGSDFQTAVNYARINSDGTLGTWSTTTALSPKVGRHASVVVNGYVYVIGGTSDNSTVLPTVNYAKLNSDGTISSWKTTTGLPEIRWDTAITSYNGYIYMVGGGDNVNAKNTTYYAKVNADGTITNWTSDSDTLPALNFGSSVVAANGYLYLTGGGNGSTANSGVYYTRLNSDGSIGAWSTGNSLLTARFSHGSFVANGYLYVTGGATGVFGATAYGTTEYAKLNSDGTVGTWYSTTAMPGQRFFNGGVPVYNGYIYMVSGITGDFTTNGNYTNSTYYTSTQRIKFNGALDLVSLSGGNNQEGNGSGGELTAGNTNIVGNLQVTGQSNFMQGVAVAGASTFQGDINLTNQADNTPHTFSSTCDCSLNSAAGTFGSETARDAVTDSVVYKGKLFVAVRETDLAGIYRYDGGTTWTLVTNVVGKAVSADTANIDSYVMTVYNGKLFIGSQTGSSTGAVYSSTTADTTADSFTLVNATRGTFASANADGVSDMAVWNGYLYIATQETNLAEIVRYGGGTTFTQVSGTDGQIDGVASVTVDSVVLAVYEGRLFAGMRTAGSAARVAVYEGVGTTWTASTTAAGTIGAETLVDDITSLTVWNGSLYAATGETDLANIYRWQVAGNTTSTTATNWIKVNNASGKAISADTANIDGFVLRAYNGRLYAGSQTNATAGTTNTGAVYELDASTFSWSLLNGTRGTFGADTNVNNVTSLIEFNRVLYVGTDDSTNGVGAVYRYTKTGSTSYALNFSSTPGNTGSLSFVGDVQTSSAGAGTGAFVLSHGIMTTSGSYDVAEDYPTRDTTLKPGDLVSIDPNETGFVRRTNVKEDSTILGIYSEKPGLRLSQSGAELDGGTAVPVALAGRVPVNVTTENGPILPGDYLTSSSIPGFAMKAIKPGPTIGKALEGFSGEGTGKIQTFVNISYFSPTASNILQGSDSNGNAMTTIQGNLLISGDINIGGFATVSQLRVTGDATFDGNLTVAKTLSTKNILVSGHITTAGEVPDVEIVTPPITDPNTNQPQANPTIAIDGNDATGTITITTTNGLPLQPGDLLKINFKSPYSKKPKVFLSPSNTDSIDKNIFREAQNGYFIIKLVEGQLDPGKTYSFDYYVIE